jgi:hypothetical protein
MLRQVRPVAWNALVASKGSQQAQDQFLREVSDYRNDWAKRKQALTAQYKGKLQDPAYLVAKANLQAEAETKLKGFGFYEEVTEAQLDTEFHDALIVAVKERPVLVLRIVTSIANYYRQQQGKSELSELQVKTRILA